MCCQGHPVSRGAQRQREVWTKDVTQRCWVRQVLTFYLCKGGGVIQPSSPTYILKTTYFINEKLCLTLLMLINMPSNTDLEIDI